MGQGDWPPQPTSPVRPAHVAGRARIAALLGEPDRAVDLLRDAIAQGFGSRLMIHGTPDFESLREYPPFEQLMAPEDAGTFRSGSVGS